MFIDTHAHLYEDDYKDDIDDVILRARDSGAQKVFVPPTDVNSTIKARDLCRRYPDFLYPMIGLHPEDVGDDYKQQLQALEQILEDDINSGRREFIGIGEVGLDYYWDRSRIQEQKDAFTIQIGWAVKYGLPLMIHARSANGDLLACLRPFRDKLAHGGVFHCFSGNDHEADELLRFHPDFMLGIGGVLTFKKSKLPETVKTVPIERIVLETDSPYMAPVPLRGKRNEPSFVPHIIARLSEAKGLSPDDVACQTTQNTLRLFDL